MTQCTCHLAGWRGEGHSSECLVTIEAAIEAYQEGLEAKVKLLREALESAWWFIENTNEDTPDRTDRFFKLRPLVYKALRESESAG